MLRAHSHAVKVELHRVRRLLRGYRVKRISGSQYASIGKEFCTIPVRRLSHISVRQVLMHCVFASTSLRQNRRLRWFLDLPSAPLARFSSCPSLWLIRFPPRHLLGCDLLNRDFLGTRGSCPRGGAAGGCGFLLGLCCCGKTFGCALQFRVGGERRKGRATRDPKQPFGEGGAPVVEVFLLPVGVSAWIVIGSLVMSRNPA